MLARAFLRNEPNKYLAFRGLQKLKVKFVSVSALLVPGNSEAELKRWVGRSRLGLAKIARRDRQSFDCATWLHKTREMPKEEFKQEGERELTGRETDPWEIIYFKLY